jgi:methionine salvage enolase-phosphatase E1
MTIFEPVLLEIRQGNREAAIQKFAGLAMCSIKEATSSVDAAIKNYRNEQRENRKIKRLHAVQEMIAKFGYKTDLQDPLYPAFIRALILNTLTSEPITKERIEKELDITKARLAREAENE